MSGAEVAGSLAPNRRTQPFSDIQADDRMAGAGRKQNGRSGACEAGKLPFVRPSVIGRIRPNPVVGCPAERSRNRTFSSGWCWRLCAHSRRSGKGMITSEADCVEFGLDSGLGTYWWRRTPPSSIRMAEIRAFMRAGTRRLCEHCWLQTNASGSRSSRARTRAGLRARDGTERSRDGRSSYK
jgi:hypothetical protein